MNFPGILLFVSTTSVVNCISLLRPNDLGRTDFLIHYHKDELTGTHTRHIHYRSDVQRSRKNQQDALFKENSNAVNPAPVYEVPSKTQINEQYEAELAVNLFTLLKGPPKDEYISNKNNNKNKTNVKLGKATTRFTQKPTQKSLPSGLQFLKKKLNSNKNKKAGSGRNKSPVKNGMDLSIQGLLGDLFVPATETPLVDTTKSTGGTLDLAYLLSGASGSQSGSSHGHDHHEHHHLHSMSGSPSDHQLHMNKDKIAARDINAHPRSPKMFKGLFNQNYVKREQHQMIAEAATTFSPHTIPVRSLYQESTVHARPITKRGVIDSESGKSIMDHILRIKIRNTTPSISTESVTRAMRYEGLGKPRTFHTQIEPLSGIDLVGVRQKNRITQKMPAALKASLADNPISSSELVRLQGIHIMISDGKQNTSDSIPTIHLTATVTENSTNNAENTRKMTTQINSSTTSKDNFNADTQQFGTVLEKIVGTAVIRNGHLYLVVYPFGANKLLELNHNQTINQIKLPQNNPIPLSVINKLIALSTPKPTTTTISPSSAKTPDFLDFNSLISGFNDLEPSPAAHVHSHHDTHSHSHSQHGQHHNMPTFDGIKLSEVNDTVLHQILTPVKRFMSPWNSLNFSQVFPYSNNKNNASRKKDEEDLDIVTFIANATDPFDKIKVILESLSNTRNKSGVVREAKFNFEVKLHANTVQNVKDTKKSATNPSNENNSEEVRTMNRRVKGTSTISAVGYDTTEPLVKSTQMPRAGSISFGTNSVNKNIRNNDAFNSKPTPSQNIEMFKNKISLTTVGGNRGFESETSTPPQTGTTDVYDSMNTTPATTFKTNTMETGGNENTNKEPIPDRLVHAAEHIATSTPSIVGVTKSYQQPRTTFTYFPNYTFSSNFRQRNSLVNTMQPRAHSAFDFSNSNAKTVNIPNSQANVPKTSPNTRQNSHSVQSERLVSLADVLQDIKKFQQQNMQKFNVRKNSFDTFLSETQQKGQLHVPVLVEGPVFKETSSRYSDIAMQDRRRNNMHNFITPEPMTSRRHWKQDQARADLRRALDAMLVLSVDDILADHTSLHGALILPQRRESSSSNNK